MSCPTCSGIPRLEGIAGQAGNDDLRSVMPDLLGHPEAGKRSEECIEKTE